MRGITTPVGRTAAGGVRLWRRVGVRALGFLTCEVVYFLTAAVLQITRSSNPAETTVAIGLVAILEIPVVFLLVFGAWFLFAWGVKLRSDYPLVVGAALGFAFAVIDTFTQIL